MTDFLCLGLVATCRIERLVYTCQLENIVINSIRTDTFAENINMYFLNENECVSYVLFCILTCISVSQIVFEIKHIHLQCASFFSS